MTIALVGMPGAGKTEVANFLIDKGFTRIRFGDITDEEMKKRGLKSGEESERIVREGLREEHGMAAYAILNLPKIRAVDGDVVIDGMRSLEEYDYLKKELKEFVVVAVHGSADIRHDRLGKREIRPFSAEEAKERDIKELENLNLAGAIAKANYTIINEGSLEDLKCRVEELLDDLK